MLFNDAVESISTIVDLKRIASAYVIDYKNLSSNEICDALKKTGPQYSHEGNIKNNLKQVFFNPDRNIRIIGLIFIKYILMNKDEYMETQKKINEDILEYEKRIINDANEQAILKNGKMNENIDLFEFILNTAWENNDSISTDEKNLLEKIKNRLNITDYEYHLVEAKISRFPKKNNELHMNSEIEEVRKYLQSLGLIFSFRDSDKIDHDIIPIEILNSLREILNIEIKQHGYRELLKTKYVRSKLYLSEILTKGKIEIKNNMKLEELQSLCLERINPSVLLAGYSPMDGLNTTDLSKWCKSLELASSGQKMELINRLICYYDGIYEKPKVSEDTRAILVDYFEDLAERKLDKLRQQGIIKKDIECESLFEKATNYIFEKYLNHKPLLQKGNEQPDGILSFHNKFVLWDNKSKETSVNLTDHLKQFDRYIKNSEKEVASFVVIGPSFTENSAKECLRYSALNETNICLITAQDLKTLAINWAANDATAEKSFPLGYFRQNGLFDISLIEIK